MSTSRTPASPSQPSVEFLEYNEGKLEVRDGLVHLLPAGWAEYGPAFSAAGLALTDRMPLAQFRAGMRTAARVSLRANDEALVAELAKLETPVEDKRFIRELLGTNGLHPMSTATILPFTPRRRGGS